MPITETPDLLSPLRRTKAVAHEMKKSSSSHNSKGMPTIKTPDLLSPQRRTKAAAHDGCENLSCYDEFSTMWLQSFLSHEQQKNEEAAQKDLSKFIELPGHLVHPHAQKHLRRSKAISPKNSNERRHIKEMRKTLLGGSLHKSVHQTKTKKKSLEGPLPYVEANTKISRVLKHVKLKTNKEDMQASRLDDFYKLVAKETTASIVLQSACRRVLATAYVKQLALETAQATKIQCFVRQFISRRVLKEQQCAKRKATLIRERFVRLYVARFCRRKQMKLENNAAVVCQSIVRMFFAKRLLTTMQLQYSWEVNQTRWKIMSLRLSFAHMRINFYARQIQCIVRRKLAQKRIAYIFSEQSAAALLIQCCWRRYSAQLYSQDLVFERSVEHQCNKLRIITSEHNYWTDKVNELRSPLKLQLKADIEEEKESLIKERQQKLEEINVLESHFEDQFNLVQQISAQDVESGWEEQIELNLTDTRERITNAKTDLLFRIQVKLKSVARKVELLLLNEKEATDSMEHWGNWRKAEQDRLWNLIRHHDDAVAEKEKRKHIIDEQMKWAVKFYVASGKPDKRRTRRRMEPDAIDNRINDLVTAAAMQMDSINEMNHLSRTWGPFQKIVDQFNNGSLLLNQGTLRKHGEEVKNFPMPSKADSKTTDGRNVNTFPHKLDWHLLKAARQEQYEIDCITNNRLK